MRFLSPEPGLSADIELTRANLKMARSVHEEAVRKVEERRDLILEEIRTHEANAELQVKRNLLPENVIEIRHEPYDLW